MNVSVSNSVAHAVRLYEQGRLGEGKYQPMPELDDILAKKLAELKVRAGQKVKVAPKVKVVRKDSLGPAGAYRKADLASPKTLQLLYVGLYKPVWAKIGPMDTVKVKTAQDVSLRGPTQKAVAAVAAEPVVAAELIKKVTSAGAKNAEGVVSHMINIGVLTVVG